MRPVIPVVPGRKFNNITMEVTSAIDHFRSVRGIVLMTNRVDGLEEALIREGRFDLKLCIDLPDEAARAKILEAQLKKLPWKSPGARSDSRQAARDCGPSGRLRFGGQRRIEAEHLRRASKAIAVRDRLQIECVEWGQLVVADAIRQDLKSLLRLLEDPDRTSAPGLEIPAGLLLVGAPGTGKTLIARLIATQTGAKFLPVNPREHSGSCSWGFC